MEHIIMSRAVVVKQNQRRNTRRSLLMQFIRHSGGTLSFVHAGVLPETACSPSPPCRQSPLPAVQWIPAHRRRPAMVAQRVVDDGEAKDMEGEALLVLQEEVLRWGGQMPLRRRHRRGRRRPTLDFA